MPAGPRCLPVPERRNGERDKVREAICTASTESAVNQVIGKRVFRDGLGPVSAGSLAEKDALAEQAEGGAAVHLALDHLEPVDVALDDS